MDTAIDKLFRKDVIVAATHCEGEYISTAFLKPKPDGSHRMILNLTLLNKSVDYQYFKLFSLNTAIDFITPDAFVAIVDLKDAY